MSISLKSDSDSRPVSMPTQVAMVLFLFLLGASWWIQDGTMSRVLLWIGIASLIWIGYRLVNLMFADLWNGYQISRLLRDNRPEEAIRRIDRFSRRPSPPSSTAVNTNNKAMALCQLSRWKEAATLLEGIDPGKLRQTFRRVVLCNFLHVLLHSDVDRARSLHEEHRSVFEHRPRMKSERQAMEQTLNFYKLVVEGDLSTESFFRQAVADCSEDSRRAAFVYYLGLIEAKKGNLTSAEEMWGRSRELNPGFDVTILQGLHGFPGSAYGEPEYE